MSAIKHMLELHPSLLLCPITKITTWMSIMNILCLGVYVFINLLFALNFSALTIMSPCLDLACNSLRFTDLKHLV